MKSFFLLSLLVCLASVAAARSSKPAHCHPRNAPFTNGSLRITDYNGDALMPKTYLKAIQRKLVLSELNNATRFLLFECDAPRSEYAQPTLAPFRGSPYWLLKFAGQLATEDHRSCLTVKNSTLTIEECAEVYGEQFAAQWMHLAGQFVSHGGKARSTPEAEVVLQGNDVTGLKDTEGKQNFLALYIDSSGRPYPNASNFATRQGLLPFLMIVPLCTALSVMWGLT